ncbi:Prolyl 4-hydroxylase subunit alpha-2 [Hypsibius exemplaris]|uniref:procollagen-proline 4-dioxygenase n=1 Tax=Hypsibius exemplaris TaxID=2072580 RepID=A0A9X6RKT0_HYPEX|nr:Prolyl 4-hydroxylase subunit alpha-2 [Hypsibius exemplaris]
MADVQNLINAERKIVEVLRLLVHSEKIRLAAIEQYIDKFNDIFEASDADADRIVSHPVNAFLLVKHLTVDWEQLRRFLEFDVGPAALADIDKHRSVVRFPEAEDIRGAAEGFVRLQRTYKIKTEDFAAGNITGIAKAQALGAFDCYLIGHRLAVDGSHDYAINWLEIALRKWHEEKEDPPAIREADILDWLQYSYYHGGNAWVALELSKKVKEIDPAFPTVEANIEYYEKLLSELPVSAVDAMKLQARPPVAFDLGGQYEALCRGEGVLPARVRQRLRCYYETHNNPYLLLQPAKFEVAHVSPDIFILHDVAFESEMEQIKTVAMTHLQRATVVKAGSAETEFAKIRISKSAFLGEDVDPVIAKVNRHIGYVTNMDMEQAEQLQIANYGIGGHYNAHYDFFRNPNDPDTKQIEPNLGDRIATFLLYMTDVEAGGATTFPVINVTLFPQKGSAAFWYNLNRDGTGDVRTLHEGCPVLSGNKWISNKWIREVGQFPTRPCGLVKDGLDPQLSKEFLPETAPVVNEFVVTDEKNDFERK